MATASARETGVSLTEIIHDLEAARALPEAALRLAVPHADEIAPAILELVEKAARGVDLIPKQENLFFWGIHVLAAGRRTELYRPLMRLLAQQDEAYLDDLLGDAVTETLTSIVISIFDGDPEPLFDICADRSVEGAVRWNLMTALARLTFDGAVPRERTLEFLDRFERESLAAPSDMAWSGWAEAIGLLGLEEMRERVHATWNDGRNPERKPDQRAWDEMLTLACSLAAGDPGLFVRDKIVALDDPVARLGWTAASEATESKDAHSPPDPAAIFALTPIEMRWIKSFFTSRHVRPGSMFMEVMDGFFCGLIAGPATAQQSEAVSALWGSQSGPDDPPNPDYDSPEQAEYVRALLARHWQTISLRLGDDHLHQPVLENRLSNAPAEAWALGFLRAVAMRAHDWAAMRGNAAMGNIITGLMGLAGREERTGKLSDKERAKLIAILPKAIRALHQFWHRGATTFERPKAPSNLKVGRNEPCPCGSGKKYKRCCGARQ